VWHALLARPVQIVALSAGCALSLAASPCLVGLPTLALLARLLAQTAIAAARGRGPALVRRAFEARRTLAEAAVALPVLGTALGAAALGASLVARATDGLPTDHTPLGALHVGAMALGGAAGLGLVTELGRAVWLGLFAALDRRIGPAEGLARGASLAAAVPMGRAARTTALVAMGPALVMATVWSLQTLDPALLIAGALAATTVAFALAAAALGALYVEAEAALARRPRVSAPTLPRVARVFFAGAAGLVVVDAVLVGLLALSPAPMRTVVNRRGLKAPDGWTTLDLRSNAVLPGTEVRVAAVEDGIVLSVPDGGGAGRVRGVAWPTAVRARPVRCGDDACFELVVEGSNRTARTVVDADGVRRDDSLFERVTRRVSPLSPCAALVALGCLAVAWRLASRSIAGAVVLTSTDEALHARAKGETRVLEGRLVAPAPAELRTVGEGRLRVEGPAYVEADGLDLRLALPSDAEVRLAPGTSTATPSDGTRVAVVAKLPARRHGYREGVLPWPPGAVLVPGGLEAARAAFAAQLDRTVAPLSVASLVALLLVTADLSVALLRA
jgi:hypothetical protein